MSLVHLGAIAMVASCQSLIVHICLKEINNEIEKVKVFK